MPDPLCAAPRVAAHAEDAVTVLGGRADAGLVLLCDHASNALPPEYGTLGLDPTELARHIAYDIGAAGMVRRIAAALDVPAVLSHYSRLLIDLNRGLDDPTLIMRLSDGAIIPGNRHLDDAERERRIARCWRPYHDAVSAVIERCLAAGVPPVLFSVHTMTDRWKGVARPWHTSVLWDPADARLAGALVAALRTEGDLIVGENEPYRGALEGDTMWQHGLRRGLAHAIIEVRQDLVGDAAGEARWAGRLIGVIERVAAPGRAVLPQPRPEPAPAMAAAAASALAPAGA
jgi:predicted N-formylglutamate amidohydrolase